MKKAYMEPTMEVVKIETTQMLANSITDGFNDELLDTGGDGGSALSPGFGQEDLIDLNFDEKLI